jgi:hypothetical protein
VEFENLHLISSLRTACSAKNEAWLNGVGRAVELRHKEGRMSELEKVHFEQLIALAEGGDWAGAEKRCFQFEKAQLNRQRTREAPHEHAHDHSHAPDGVAVAGR